LPLREERSFDADGPVGAYWLRNSTGFRVVVPRRRSGWVEEVGVRESDGRVDVLAVRKRGLFRSHVTIVPAERVTVVSPWNQTVVLAPKRRRRQPVAALPAAPARPSPLGPEPETLILPPPVVEEPVPASLPVEETQPPVPAPTPVPVEPQPPREPKVGPALRTAGAASGRGLVAAGGASGRGLLAASVVALALARGFAHYAFLFLRAVGAQLVLGLALLRRHAPTAGRFVAELAAFGVAAVTGLVRFTTLYARTWRRELAAWRATRRWQESRPEPPTHVRPPSPNGTRPGAAPTRAAPPSRRG
jgi:hypothetical protein